MMSLKKEKGLTNEELRERLKELIKEIDTIIERLEIDEEHQPLKLLGVKASYALMDKIYSTLTTIGIAVAFTLYYKIFSSATAAAPV
jgi:hypothetical protein